MYKIVFIDESNNVIVVDENCENIIIKNNNEDIYFKKNGYDEFKLGCKVNQYFIFNNDIEVNDVLTNEMKKQSIDLKQFIYIEPEKIIDLQNEYIQALEQKLKQLETSN